MPPDAPLSAADLMGECCNVLKGNTEKYNEKTEKLLEALKTLEKQIKENTEQLAALVARLVKKGSGKSKGGGGKGGGNLGVGDMGDIGDDGKKAGEKFGLDFTEGFKKSFDVKSIASSISNALGRPVDMMFKGLITKELDFMVNMSEIGYVTKGITGDFEDLQEEFQRIGKTAHLTGQSRAALQESLVKNLKRGVNTEKEMLKVTIDGLHASTMVGDKSNEIADTLAQWHMHLNLSTGQTAAFGREIIAVSRRTGVMGENLAQVVKQSESILKTMRNMGTLTSQGAGNVIGLLASGSKFGVAEEMNELVSAGSNFYKLINSTDAKTKNLLYTIAAMSGKMDDLYTNTFFTTREGAAAIAEGYEKIIQRLGVSLDMSPLLITAKKLAEVNYVLQATYGKTFGQMQQERKAALEHAKTFKQQVEEITKKLQDQNTTTKEQVKLRADLKNLEMSRGMQVMDKVREMAAASTAQTFEKNVQAAITNDKAMLQDLKDAGKWATAQGALQFSAEKLKAAGGDDFTAEASQKLGLKASKELMEKIDENYKKLTIEQKTGVNALTKLEQTFNKINDTLLETLGPIVRSNLALIIGIGVIGGSIAQLVTYAYGVLQAASLAVTKMSMMGGGGGGGMPIPGGGKGPIPIGRGVIPGAMGGATAVRMSAGAIPPVRAAAAVGAPIRAAAAAGTALKVGRGGGALRAIGGGLGVLKGFWPIAVLGGAISGIAGGIDGVNEASEIFGKNVEDLTAGEKRLAAASGAVTGAIEGLSLGFIKLKNKTLLDFFGFTKPKPKPPTPSTAEDFRKMAGIEFLDEESIRENLIERKNAEYRAKKRNAKKESFNIWKPDLTLPVNNTQIEGQYDIFGDLEGLTGDARNKKLMELMGNTHAFQERTPKQEKQIKDADYLKDVAEFTHIRKMATNEAKTVMQAKEQQNHLLGLAQQRRNWLKEENSEIKMMRDYMSKDSMITPQPIGNSPQNRAKLKALIEKANRHEIEIKDYEKRAKQIDLLPGSRDAASASAPSLLNVDERMRQENLVKTGAQSPNGALEQIGDEQTNLLTDIKTEIIELRKAIGSHETTPAGSAGIDSMASSQSIPSRSPDYGKWQFGTYSSTPGVQRVNDGVS